MFQKIEFSNQSTIEKSFRSSVTGGKSDWWSIIIISGNTTTYDLGKQAAWLLFKQLQDTLTSITCKIDSFQIVEKYDKEFRYLNFRAIKAFPFR